MGKRGQKTGTPFAKTLAKRRGRARALRLAEVTAERTMLEIARVAFTDRRTCVTKPLKEWTPAERTELADYMINLWQQWKAKHAASERTTVAESAGDPVDGA